LDRYAIGGAVGASFYMEPVATFDLDVFIELHASPSALIVDTKAIIDYVLERGGAIEKDYVVIADSPVQFLPPATPLAEEALKEAVEKPIEDTPAYVFTAEHIAALALQLGRGKDKARLLQFIEAGVLDQNRFRSIIERYGLTGQWEQFERQFLSS
jgi:hypothetical protein